jgi:hypothetical protein
LTVPEIVHLLEGHRFDESSEDALQRGIAQVLSAAGASFTREVPLSPFDRIDFLVGQIGIECKIDGSLSALTRQLHRYAVADQVAALVVVTARARLARVPISLHGKPIAVVATMGGIV